MEEAFDYRSETFSPPPCDQLLCGICHCVFYKPMECPCQHVFCKNCIEHWLHGHGTCPECRQPIDASSLAKASRLIRNIILNLKIQCQNRSRGCQEVCFVEHYEIHLKTCPYQVVKCSNGNCESEILLKEKTKHEDTECFFYYATCTVCKKPTIRHKLLDHDCFGVLTAELDSLRQRVTELEDEKGLLQLQIRDISKKHLEMLEGITRTLHDIGDLKEQKCAKYAEERAVICTLQKEVEMLQNLVKAIPKSSEQNIGSDKSKNHQHEIPLFSEGRKAFCFCITVFLICLLYQQCATV